MTAEELAAWRAAHGLTQDQMGAKLGVKRNTIARWEGGIRAIPHQLARRLEGITAVEDVDAIRGTLTRLDAQYAALDASNEAMRRILDTIVAQQQWQIAALASILPLIKRMAGEEA